MDKRLKIGLICMMAAVVVMPIAFLFRNVTPSLTIVILIVSMLLEIVGLGLVIFNLLQRRKK